ncbi:alpha/beta fold hydrolase [Humidisolicoccus flavus]|uniref:alpha/beta hydrolase n=1 Tax=Humidisolicoccus flavus TaxID=3111414 RepID=UPI00324C960E
MSTLFLHGLGGSGNQMRPYAARVQGQIIAPDILSHGNNPRSASGDEFAFDSLADDAVEQFLARWDRTPVNIVGVSMGAAIALRIVLSGRLPVERVAFLRPSFTSYGLPENLTIFPLMAQLLEQETQHTVLDALLDTKLYSDIERLSPAGGLALHAQVTQPRARERRERLLEIPRNRAYTANELESVQIPRVVLASPRDPVHPVSIAHEWAEGLRCRVLLSPARDDGQAAVTNWYQEHVQSFLMPY